ncbi:MAG: FAD-dependent oxidoreductase, partial [Anaerolineaceae bacterium]|nr:FAD-dependent oxidoreductase [Anaerolineaceae bacterium]
MKDIRIRNHPILAYPDSKPITFLWNNQEMIGYSHETISSALIANGIDIFGLHHKDQSPQGIFCTNGQCAQCTVFVNGYAKKACMTYLDEGMDLSPLDQLPKAHAFMKPLQQSFHKEVETINIPVLIIGGGPAGLAASIELGKLNIETILVDDKEKLGGKLVLQTHRFFGSANEVYAGHRGIEIAKILSEEVSHHETIHCWTSARLVGVFADKKVGVVQSTGQYILIKPELLLIAAGARENTLAFPGNTLPGVFGAGAFQTLVNRDLVRPSENVFIVGGGNVGLIAGYHAMQAGINVGGLIEAMPNCGGYLVHEQKLRRLGIPILTSHTIVSANGSTHVESITISKCDEQFLPIDGTEKTFRCDSILIAVGLHPVNEFYKKAQEFDMKVFAAGDAQEIAEASAAMI